MTEKYQRNIITELCVNISHGINNDVLTENRIINFDIDCDNVNIRMHTQMSYLPNEQKQ